MPSRCSSTSKPSRRSVNATTSSTPGSSSTTSTLACALMRRHRLAHARLLEHDAHARALAGRRVELDPAVEAAHRLRARSRARARSPPRRDPCRGRSGRRRAAASPAVMPTPVSSTSTRSVLPRRVRAQHDRGPRCVCFAAFSPRLRSTCSSRSRLTIAPRSGGHSTSTATPSGGRRLVGDLLRAAARSATGSTRGCSWPGVRARERQQRAREPREPRRLALDVGEEAVALDRIVLRARLQHLDRADDRRQRRAQLVRGVRDELALGELAALLLGQVVEHDQHRVALRLRRDADDARARARRRA